MFNASAINRLHSRFTLGLDCFEYLEASFTDLRDHDVIHVVCFDASLLQGLKCFLVIVRTVAQCCGSQYSFADLVGVSTSASFARAYPLVSSMLSFLLKFCIVNHCFSQSLLLLLSLSQNVCCPTLLKAFSCPSPDHVNSAFEVSSNDLKYFLCFSECTFRFASKKSFADLYVVCISGPI